MTGYYVRVQRDDDSIDNIDIAKLTDSEFERFSKSQEDGWKWVKALLALIKNQENSFLKLLDEAQIMYEHYEKRYPKFCIEKWPSEIKDYNEYNIVEVISSNGKKQYWFFLYGDLISVC